MVEEGAPKTLRWHCSSWSQAGRSTGRGLGDRPFSDQPLAPVLEPEADCCLRTAVGLEAGKAKQGHDKTLKQIMLFLRFSSKPRRNSLDGGSTSDEISLYAVITEFVLYSDIISLLYTFLVNVYFYLEEKYFLLVLNVIEYLAPQKVGSCHNIFPYCINPFHQ